VASLGDCIAQEREHRRIAEVWFQILSEEDDLCSEGVAQASHDRFCGRRRGKNALRFLFQLQNR